MDRKETGLRKVSTIARMPQYLDRFAGTGDQRMDSQPTEVTPLANDVAAIHFALIPPCTANPDVIAGGKGEAVDHVDRVGVELFERLAKRLEHAEKQLRNSVQATLEAAFTEHRRDVTGAAEQLPRLLPVTPKMQGEHNRRGHHLSIAHLTLRVFVMIEFTTVHFFMDHAIIWKNL